MGAMNVENFADEYVGKEVEVILNTGDRFKGVITEWRGDKWVKLITEGDEVVILNLDFIAAVTIKN